MSRDLGICRQCLEGLGGGRSEVREASQTRTATKGRNGSHSGVILPSGGDSTTSGDIFICHKCAGGGREVGMPLNTLTLENYKLSGPIHQQLRNPGMGEC